MGRIDFTKPTYYGSDSLYKSWMTSGDTKKGDLVFTMEAPLGNIALIPDNQRYILSQRVILIRTKSNIVINTFLYYLFASELFKNKLQKESTGTTAKGIKRTRLEKINILLPPLQEQKKIAAILSSVDRAIETTQNAIAQLQIVKRGLMQQLLTKGIPGWHQEYQDTKIGSFPVSWNILKIGKFAFCKQGYTFKPRYQGNSVGNYMYAKVSDMESMGNEKFIKYTANYINDDVLQEMKAKLFPKLSVIFPRVGAAINTNKKRMLLNNCLVDDNVMTVTINNLGKCSPFYLFRWLESTNLIRFSNSGHPPSINSKNLLNTLVPLPPLPEQEKIADILTSIDKRIEAEKAKKAQVEIIKKGLMQQLLTGIMKVKV